MLARMASGEGAPGAERNLALALAGLLALPAGVLALRRR